MITEVRLIQIKDTYNGNTDILIPLVKLLKECLSVAFAIDETIVVFKSPEWIREMQVYEPLSTFSYLIKALKLAYPDPKVQSYTWINVLESPLEAVELQQKELQQKILIESSKLKVLINKGDKFITAYANNILKEEESVSQLSQFSQLVNNAEVSNDPE